MSIFIEGMNMPEAGIYKALLQVDKDGKGKIAVINSPFVRDYQTYDLDVIPIPHGDLIDKDLYRGLLLDMWKDGGTYMISDLIRELAGVPAVIDAEEKYDTSSTHTEDICSWFQTRIAGEWQ